MLILRRLNIVGISRHLLISWAIGWIPPLQGWYKVNTDGAAKGCPGIAGAGGIFRLFSGVSVGSFDVPLGT